MHICFITSEFPKAGFAHGGVGTFVATLAKALVTKGVRLSVIGLNYIPKNETEIIDGVHVYRVTAKKIKVLQWYFNTQAVAQKIKEVHGQFPIDFVETPELGLAFLPKLKDIQYVIRMHGGHHFFAKAENRPTEWWKVFQEKRSFQKADRIVAVSHYVAETTREMLQLGDREIKVIYNPIDVQKFHLCDPTKEDPYSLFFAGSLIEKKGIRQLVQSLNYLVDAFPEVHLYIAGRDAHLPGTTTPYRPILEQEINAKIKPHITFLGVVPNSEIKNHIERAQICCYPSHMEAMPLAWLEVLAMGKTFIGGATGPGPEAVLEGITGVLADPHDPKDIAAKIKYLFERPQKGIEMGIAARERVLKEFDIDVIVMQNKVYFEALLR